MAEKKLKIALVDDHPIVIEGLKSLFINRSDRYEVSSFVSGTSFLSFIRSNRVDAVLLDIALPDSNGVDICKAIKETSPDTVVIGLSNKDEQSIIVQLLENGASGFLFKSTPASDILSSIDAALKGEVVMSNEIKNIVFSPVKRNLPSLTKREKEILNLLSQGKTSLEIADDLYLSKLTVDTYRKNLLQKFSVKNTSELLMFLVENNRL